MLSRPSKGYGWTCAPCSRAHEEEVEKHDMRHHTPVGTKPKAGGAAARGRGRPRKDKTLAEKEDVEIKHFKMWPFRYFGCVARVRADGDEIPCSPSPFTSWLTTLQRIE